MNAEFDRNRPPMFQRPVLRRTCNNWLKTGRERAGNVQLNPPKKRAKAAIWSAFVDYLKIRFPHGSVGSSPTGGTIAKTQAGGRFIFEVGRGRQRSAWQSGIALGANWVRSAKVAPVGDNSAELATDLLREELSAKGLFSTESANSGRNVLFVLSWSVCLIASA